MKLDEKSLARVGVRIVSPSDLRLQCQMCKCEWSPIQPAEGKRLPKGWWKCPNVCAENFNVQICSTCKESKPIDDFYPNRRKCKKCHIDQVKANQSQHPLQTRLNGARSSQRSRAGGMTSEDNLSEDDLAFLLEAQGNICLKCLREFENMNFEIAHITSVGHGGHLTRNNIQLLHQKCNIEQGEKAIIYWKATISMALPITSDP